MAGEDDRETTDEFMGRFKVDEPGYGRGGRAGTHASAILSTAVMIASLLLCVYVVFFLWIPLSTEVESLRIETGAAEDALQKAESERQALRSELDEEETLLESCEEAKVELQATLDGKTKEADALDAQSRKAAKTKRPVRRTNKRRRR